MADEDNEPCEICGATVADCECDEEDRLAWLLHGRKKTSQDLHGGILLGHAAGEIERLRGILQSFTYCQCSSCGGYWWVRHGVGAYCPHCGSQ